MSDFLDSLIDRSLAAGPAPTATLRPMLPSRFESSRGTPLFGSAGRDFNPDVSHDDTANQTVSPSGSANAADSPRSSSVPNSDWDPDNARSLSPLPSMAIGATTDNSTREWRPAVERPRDEAALEYAPQMSQPLESDDNSWLHHRMDEMAVQLQRLRGDMASPMPSRSGAMFPGATSHHELDLKPRPVLPRTEESAAVGRRPAPSLEDAARGEDDSRFVASRGTQNRFHDHPAQSLPPSPDFERLERLLSLADRTTTQSPPKLLSEIAPSVPRQAVPTTHPDEQRSPQLSPAPEFGQLDQLLALAGRAAMQPPPRIQPEDLPSSRQPAPVEKTINVTIGRVEVKAIREPAPVRRPPPQQANSSVMSLDDYLKQRAAGGL